MELVELWWQWLVFAILVIMTAGVAYGVYLLNCVVGMGDHFLRNVAPKMKNVEIDRD